ncbi:hypothetical protein SAMN02745823_01426 [Sporobacter termitidis DSM 10068]|uniref:Uncharacterized protein n=1 Tax=Sporobacter termitidis DSM 10068 TaxID=1123282 RepID=A0A1M5WW57_9FIRM|nr:hypothetical protein [Sporobacter termitidis]SHH91829.1 hypothetical protein SAMN02745823_01426 [Sporobacter termitidis DSM 10068]
MYKKPLLVLLCFLALLTATQTTASADTGPKPSVVVSFKGLGEKNCYVTLLSKTSSTGPYSVYNNVPDYAPYKEDDVKYKIWEKFVSYRDGDGFYFLQYFMKPDDRSVFTWGYFPPEEFKILMYFPETDSFVKSAEIYTRYAFDSYYTVDASGLGASSGTDGGTVTAVRNYNYDWELVSLLARIVLTIAVELVIALFFGFRAKKQLLVIGLTNVTTQTILNVLLNVVDYNLGPMAFVWYYILFELLVFALEAYVYYVTLNQYGGKEPAGKWRPVFYALAANSVSFITGLAAARLVPGIF